MNERNDIPTVEEVMAENERLKRVVEGLEKRNAYLQGMVEGLKFAVRCDGVSGAEIHEDMIYGVKKP